MKMTMLAFLVLLGGSLVAQQEGIHLFILSGQSNMEALDPQVSFVPTLEEKFGHKQVRVAKYALGGQPIRRWYAQDDQLEAHPTDLYDSLTTRVNAILGEAEVLTVTLVWMQGERDAREQLGDSYESNLMGLYTRLSKDFGRPDMNFVIGRLSDFDLKNEKYPHWTLVREAQQRLAASNPRFGWIDTDDLNDGVNAAGKEIHNDLHMSAKGYELMGKRFAEMSIQLIQMNH